MKTSICSVTTIAFLLISQSLCFSKGIQTRDKSCCKPTEICIPSSKWHDANETSFEMRYPNSKNAYYFKLEDNNNFVAKADYTRNGIRSGSDIMVISGKGMLIKTTNFNIKNPQLAIDYLDEPVLMNKLILTLLELAFPAGPYLTESTHDVKRTENEKGIKVSTYSAGGLFGPPWILKADIEKIKSQSFHYKMLFSFTDMRGATDSKRFYEISGEWRKIETPYTIPDDLKIEGWELYWIAPVKRSEERLNTIADIRRIVRKSKQNNGSSD